MFFQESLAKEGKMCLEIILSFQKTYPTSKVKNRDFCGGAMDKNLPANAGDRGWIPGLERFHIPRINEAHAPQVVSPCSRPKAATTAPAFLHPEPMFPNRRNHCNEKPMHVNEE